MGRFLTERVVVCGDLIACTPVHIGGGNSELFADMLVARNGENVAYIPGTSLAGPMRAWWDRAFPASLDRVWGAAEQEGRSDAGSASMLRVEDAHVCGTESSEFRDSVGIDRYSGSAADGIKFDREVLPKGTVFNFSLVLEIPTNSESPNQVKSEFAAMLAALEAGQIRFGGAKTRGLGKLELKNAKASTCRMDAGDAMLEALLNPPVTRIEAFKTLVANPAKTQSRRIVDVEIHWRSVRPLMNKDARQGFIIDAIPLTTGVGDEVELVLAGAGIKGVQRAHSERIIRTLMKKGPGLPEGDEEKQAFNNSLVPDEIIEWLYGAKGQVEETKKTGMGAVFVDDCYPENDPIPRELINQLLTNTPENDRDKTRDVQRLLSDCSATQRFYPSQHNAIDRWLGGAADSALFSVLEPGLTKGVFTIQLDLDRLAPGQSIAEKRATLALFLLTLRDFKQGVLPVGFGVNRGLGAIDVTKIDLALSFDDKLKDEGWPDLGGELSELDNVLDDLKTDWETYAKKLLACEGVAT